MFKAIGTIGTISYDRTVDQSVPIVGHNGLQKVSIDAHHKQQSASYSIGMGIYRLPIDLCVFLQMKPFFHSTGRHPAHPGSVILHPITRDIQALWSQNYTTWSIVFSDGPVRCT